MYSVTCMSLKFFLYFRRHLQPFLYFTDDNNFESKICLHVTDQVGSVLKTHKISPNLFPSAHIFVEEDGGGGDSLHCYCVN